MGIDDNALDNSSILASFRVVVERGFPPPDARQVQDLLKLLCAHAKSIARSEIEIINEFISELVNAPKTTDPSLNQRVSALQAVLCAMRSPSDWEIAIGKTDQNWPTWGTPHLLAAEAVLKESDEATSTCDKLRSLKLAEKWLQQAHLVVRVGEFKLLRVADRLRNVAMKLEKGQPRDNLTLLRPYQAAEETAFRLLIQHKPIFSNLNNLADLAKNTQDDDLLGWVIEHCRKTHGKSATAWVVESRNDELRAAGSICAHAARYYSQARSLQPWEIEQWSLTALHYFNLALVSSAGNRDTELDDKHLLPHFTLLRICENYAAMVRYSLPRGQTIQGLDLLIEETRTSLVKMQNLEYQLKVKAALGEINKLAPVEWVTQLPLTLLQNLEGEDQHKHAYTYYRHHLAMFAAQVSGCEGPAASSRKQLYVEKARSWVNGLANPNKKKAAAEIVATEITSLGLYDAASEIAAQFLSNRSRVPSAFYTALTTARQPLEIRDLIDEAGRQFTSRNPTLAEFCNISLGLHRILRITDHLDDCLGEKLKCVVAASNGIGGYIVTAKNGIKKGADSLDEAIKLMDLVDWVQGWGTITLDLRADHAIQSFKEGRSELEPMISTLAAAMKEPGSAGDQRLQTRLLQCLGLSRNAVPIDLPIWEWACATTDSYRCNNMANVLKWHASTGSLCGWAPHFTQALAEFPTEPRVLDLLWHLWNAQQGKALAAICEIFQISYAGAQLGALASAMERLPGTCFFQLIQSNGFSTVVSNNSKRPGFQFSMRGFVDGLCRHQIEMWHDDSRRKGLATQAADWIFHSAPNASKAWAQWLGGERGQFSTKVLGYLATELEDLKRELLKLENSSDWVRLLTAFINSKPVHQSAAKSADNVVAHCTDASINYAPARPDPAYWPCLEALVSARNLTACEATKIWMDVHLAIEARMIEDIDSTCYLQIHHFKNQLDPANHSVVTEEWKDQLSMVIGKSIKYLYWHRWPQARPTDLRSVLCEAAYRAPFAPTSTSRSTDQPAPWLFAFRPNEPIMVMADAELLTEALCSLIDNSREWSTPEPNRPNGWIRAEVARDGQDAVIKVMDSGNSKNRKLCEFVEKLNRSSKAFSGRGSTGYGTRLCRRIVAMHGGSGPTYRVCTVFGSSGLVVEIRLPLFQVEKVCYE